MCALFWKRRSGKNCSTNRPTVHRHVCEALVWVCDALSLPHAALMYAMAAWGAAQQCQAALAALVRGAGWSAQAAQGPLQDSLATLRGACTWGPFLAAPGCAEQPSACLASDLEVRV